MGKNNIAILDLGSNSFHINIFKRNSLFEWQSIKRDRILTQITSTESGDFNFLSKEGISRSINAIEKFYHLIKKYDSDVYAYATSAIRDAANKNLFLEKVKEKFGLEINIISGEEEAYFIFLSVCSKFKLFDDDLTVIDIGGGSTEIITGSISNIKFSTSVHLGAVRLTKQFFPNEIVSSQEIENCSKYIQNILQSSKLNIFGNKIIGTSGTIQAMCKIVLGFRGINTENKYTFNEIVISKDELLPIYNEIIGTKKKNDLLKINGMNSERVQIAHAGAMIFYNLFEHLKLENLIVSSATIKEGLLINLIGPDNIRNINIIF